MNEILDVILKLPVDEKLQILNALKQDLNEIDDDNLTQSQIEFLEERDKLLEGGNYQTLTWEEIKRKLSERKGYV